jgi:hypothetical protein
MCHKNTGGTGMRSLIFGRAPTTESGQKNDAGRMFLAVVSNHYALRASRVSDYAVVTIDSSTW